MLPILAQTALWYTSPLIPGIEPEGGHCSAVAIGVNGYGTKRDAVVNPGVLPDDGIVTVRVLPQIVGQPCLQIRSPPGQHLLLHLVGDHPEAGVAAPCPVDLDNGDAPGGEELLHQIATEFAPSILPVVRCLHPDIDLVREDRQPSQNADDEEEKPQHETRQFRPRILGTRPGNTGHAGFLRPEPPFLLPCLQPLNQHHRCLRLPHVIPPLFSIRGFRSRPGGPPRASMISPVKGKRWLISRRDSQSSFACVRFFRSAGLADRP